jgi:2-keto-4-pentenoate hydratase/2-oxohepta-3-ene-1,7-dioic acid hydratase in catechol pathway
MQLTRSTYGVSISTPTGELPIGQILAIGRNYAEHAKEQSAAVPTRPMLFTKHFTSAILHEDPIIIPKICQDPSTGGDQTDFEAELCVILGKPARDVPESAALDHILGYCCANDVSARWWQKEGSGGQFVRGKSFDTFCPLGPRIIPAAEIKDPQALRVRCRVNGQTMQDAPTSDMMFSVPYLIAELSCGATLPPGTAILTGTPSGVGMARKPPVWLKDGDTVEVEIDGIGTLRNPVRLER